MIASPSDEAAVRRIIQDERIAWNKGDAEAHARYFATDGTLPEVECFPLIIIGPIPSPGELFVNGPTSS